MKNKKLITIEFFSGFYESIHGAQFDNEIEQYLEENDKTSDDIDYTCDFKAYSKEYVNQLNSEIDLNLEFESLESPKYYNYSTDRIFCNINSADIEKLAEYRNKPIFAELIKSRFTSRDGFSSFYSNEVADWIEKPLAEYDHNELAVLLDCYAFDKFKNWVETEAGFINTSATIQEVLHNLDNELATNTACNGGVVIDYK
jgi:hypothetical protein